MIARHTQLLSDQQVQRIHHASIEILSEVGLEVEHGPARETFRHHGCNVNDQSRRVKLPGPVIEEFLPMVPERFTFRALNPEFDRTIPDQAPLIMTASSAPNIIDPTTGQDRRATSEDLARIARLINELEGIDLFSVSTLADDAPQGHYSLTRFYTALKHCRKPIRGSGDPGIDSATILKMASMVAGSEAAYRDHPFITHHFCPIISPLKMDENSTEMLMFYVREGLPCHATVVPNGGLTAPFSLAGTLVQGNAEFLALAVLTQMVKAQTPLIYSSLSTMADLRRAAYAPGGIECGLLNMAHAQMAKHYRIPCSGYIGLTNSKLVDAQAGYEKALSCMGGLTAGIDVLQFVGLIDSLLSFDFGMAVIDNEIALMLKRVARGMEFSEEALALDEIAEVGPSGMFITTERTVQHMQEGAFLPEIADREPRATWLSKGGLSAQDKALRRAREILATNYSTFLSPEVETRLRAAFPGLVQADLTSPC